MNFWRLLVMVTVLAASVVTLRAENWPQWRGPLLNGISGEKNLPVRWSTDREHHLEAGAAGAVGLDADRLGRPHLPQRRRRQRPVSLGVDRAHGAVRWKRPLGGGNRRMRKQNMSSPSPVTDGRHVWVMTGTGMLKAFDFDGKELWARDIQKDYGAFGLQWGYASSPLLHRGLAVRAGAARHAHRRSVVPAADRQGDRQDALARRAADQRAVRVARRLHDAGAAALRQRHARSSSPAATWSPATTRRPARSCGAPTASIPRNDGSYRIVASPVVHGDLIFAPSRERPLLALKPGGRGDVTNVARAVVVQQRPGRADAGHRRHVSLLDQRPRHHVLPRREDRQDGLRPPAAAQRDLQRVAGAGRRQDLHHRRRRRDERGAGRAEVRAAGRERSRRLHAQLAGGLRGADLHPHRVVPLRDRNAKTKWDVRTVRMFGIVRSERSYAVGRKYSTIPAPIEASRNPTNSIGLSAAFGGWITIETSTLTIGRAAEDERHHVDRKTAGSERPDDAGGAGGAERAGDGRDDEPVGVEVRQLPCELRAATGTSTPIRK